MATYKLALLLALSLSLLASGAVGGRRQSQAQQCRFNQITRSQPSRRIESEGGVSDVWDENEDQFRCAGVAPLRNILQPNSLSLPNFHPAPRLVYIERGQGLLGVHFPGCAETFQSSEGGRQEEQGRGGQDQHQKIHRIRRGDIVALPSGVAHWCFNDGDEELVAVSITDLNNEANQLDQQLRAFYLAGGPQKHGRQGQQGGRQGQRGLENSQNIFRGFDEEMLAEAFNVDRETVRKMQRQDDRGLAVKVQEGMGMIRPDEREEEEGEYGRRLNLNGLEETLCTMRLHQNIDDRREAEVYSRGGGRLNVVNQNKLPILQHLDLSAEKGHLFPNAMYTPSWSINSHSIVYITRGEAEVQIADQRGQSVMNDRVSHGDMFVVPQFYAATIRAQGDGVEWVSFKTNGLPMRSSTAGYTSVLRAMPLHVLSSSYQISTGEAHSLKYNRGRETFLASPRRRS